MPSFFLLMTQTGLKGDISNYISISESCFGQVNFTSLDTNKDPNITPLLPKTQLLL